MYTREEDVGEAKEIEANAQIRRGDLRWAEQWHQGSAQCPRCNGTEFRVVDVEHEGQMRYESFQCKAASCGVRWKVEFRDAALVVMGDAIGCEDDWIEFSNQDGFSERETATILAALRYWQRTGSTGGTLERDIATDCDGLEPLSREEIDALCERINTV